MIKKCATQAGNSIIREVAAPVTFPLPVKAKKIITDLTDTMRFHGLLGMAAPQIGRQSRIFVSEIRKTALRKADPDSLRVFINPEIVSSSKKQISDWEGCGSVAFGNLFAKVRRPVSITVVFFNQTGERQELKATGLLARIIQHELDHLDGILFTDTADTSTYMSRDEYLKMRRKENKGN